MDLVAKASEMFPNISKEQVAEYKEAFALFDKDGNGKIEAAELLVRVPHKPSHSVPLSRVKVSGCHEPHRPWGRVST